MGRLCFLENGEYNLTQTMFRKTHHYTSKSVYDKPTP